MDQNKVNQILFTLSSKLPPETIPMVRERLLNSDVDEMVFYSLTSTLKDPTISLVLSIVLGYFGVDRFYIGDVGLGVGKLVTCGGCYIWWLIDIFLIMNRTRQRNFEMLMAQLNMQSAYNY